MYLQRNLQKDMEYSGLRLYQNPKYNNNNNNKRMKMNKNKKINN